MSCTASTLGTGAAGPRLGWPERAVAADQLGSRAVAARPGGSAGFSLREADEDAEPPRNPGPVLAAIRLLARLRAGAAGTGLADRCLRLGVPLHAHDPARPDRRSGAALLRRRADRARAAAGAALPVRQQAPLSHPSGGRAAAVGLQPRALAHPV